MYQSAPRAAEFWGHVADEVHAACENTLECTKLRHTMMPSLQAEDLPIIKECAWRGVKILAGRHAFTVGDLSPAPDVSENSAARAFRNLTRDRLRSRWSMDLPESAIDTLKLGALRLIARAYGGVLPYALVGALACCIFDLVHAVRRRCVLALDWILLAGLMAVAARVAILSVLEATSFAYAVAPLYMSAACPLAVLCAVLGYRTAWDHARTNPFPETFPSPRPSSRAPAAHTPTPR